MLLDVKVRILRHLLLHAQFAAVLELRVLVRLAKTRARHESEQQIDGEEEGNRCSPERQIGMGGGRKSVERSSKSVLTRSFSRSLFPLSGFGVEGADAALPPPPHESMACSNERGSCSKKKRKDPRGQISPPCLVFGDCRILELAVVQMHTCR
jgi:hypothetical protein